MVGNYHPGSELDEIFDIENLLFTDRIDSESLHAQWNFLNRLADFTGRNYDLLKTIYIISFLTVLTECRIGQNEPHCDEYRCRGFRIFIHLMKLPKVID